MNELTERIKKSKNPFALVAILECIPNEGGLNIHSASYFGISESDLENSLATLKSLELIHGDVVSKKKYVSKTPAGKEYRWYSFENLPEIMHWDDLRPGELSYLFKRAQPFFETHSYTSSVIFPTNELQAIREELFRLFEPFKIMEQEKMRALGRLPLDSQIKYSVFQQLDPLRNVKGSTVEIKAVVPYRSLEEALHNNLSMVNLEGLKLEKKQYNVIFRGERKKDGETFEARIIFPSDRWVGPVHYHREGVQKYRELFNTMREHLSDKRIA